VSAASTPRIAVAAVVFDDVDSLLGAVGRDLGVTSWCTLDEAQLGGYAAATWSPVPLPGEPAPPLLLLALTNRFLPELLDVRGASSGINYGAGRVRFGAAVAPTERVRGRATMTEAVTVPGGVQTTIEVRVEVEGGHEPACVVESLSRWMR